MLLSGYSNGSVKIFDQFVREKMTIETNSLKNETWADPVISMTTSPIDTLFCTGSEDKLVKLWDLKSQSPEKTSGVYSGHNDSVLAMHWHPQINLMTSGSGDKTIKFWDHRDKTCIKTIYDHTSRVTVVEFNNNGHWLLSGSADRTCRLFDIRNYKQVQIFRGHSLGVNHLTWHPSHEDLFTSCADDGSFVCWLVGYTIPQAHHTSQNYDSLTTIWHPDGKLLATGSRHSCMKLWVRSRCCKNTQ